MERHGIINFEVFEDGSNYLGLANVQLPTLTRKNFTVNGAGIAGDVDIPVPGNYNAMHTTINFINSSAGAPKLLAGRRHLIECRVANTGFDPTSGKLRTKGDKFIMEVCPLTETKGTVAPASTQGESAEFTVFSYKEIVGGKLVRHVDPFNYIDIDADGVNRLADVKSALGK